MNSGPGVLDREFHVTVVPIRGADRDGPGARELERVGHQVQQNALQFDGMPQAAIDVGSNEQDLEVLLRRERADHILYLREELGDREGPRLRLLELVPLARHLQRVAGEAIERMGGGVDQTELALLQRREGPAPALLQAVRQQVQRAEWRAHVVHELDEEFETLDADERRARELLKAALDRGAPEAHSVDRLQDLGGGRVFAGAPQREHFVFQQIDEMQAEPERRPRRQRVYKGSVAAIGGECRRRENAWDIGAVRGCPVRLVPARFDAANRMREQAAAHPRNGIKPDAWLGKALPDVTGLGGGPVHNRSHLFPLSVIRGVIPFVTHPRTIALLWVRD